MRKVREVLRQLMPNQTFLRTRLAVNRTRVMPYIKRRATDVMRYPGRPANRSPST